MKKRIPFSSGFLDHVLEFNSQKHLVVVLDNSLSSEGHFKMVLNKVNETIGLLRKIQNILPRLALPTIYKKFIRAHLYYSVIIYDLAYGT